MLNRIKIGIVVSFLLVPIFCFSQNNTASHEIEIQIKEVALIGISNAISNQISFHPFGGREAGSSLTFGSAQSNNSVWINYSSIKKYEQQRRTVTAFVEGEVPDGLNLIVTAMPAQGAGDGALGESAGTTLLGKQPSEIITGIGSCYTGTGVNNGHNLIYNLDVDEGALSYADLNEEELTFNVVYTLTD